MHPQKYIAHTRKQDGEEQPLLAHLQAVAKRASEHTKSLGEEFARVCGLTHDIEKYSAAFQAHIRGDTRRVDHATGGGQLLYDKSKLGILCAYCVMGHHGGLPNGGAYGQDTGDNKTLYGRLKRRVEPYDAYRHEVTIPPMVSLTQEWRDGFASFCFV